MSYTLFLCLLVSTFVDANLVMKFESWLKEHNYSLDEKTYESVFQNWIENDDYINEVNTRNTTYILGHNKYSGMSSAEFSDFMGFQNNRVYLKELNDRTFTHRQILSDIASNVNWVEKGAVTDVKDQGQCGSCWSFSTTGALEGAFYIQNGNLESFSEQELVDCDKLGNGGSNHGCNGGLMDTAFEWIINKKGLCSEHDYPYESGTTQKRGDCRSSLCENVKNSNIKDFHDVPPSSDESMMSSLTQQPVSIAIQADQKDFQLYKSGVFTGSCGTKLDHGVLVVGYDSENGEDYYLVKNSWSESWGDHGYIKLGRGPQYNNGDGQCGMLLQASYPSY